MSFNATRLAATLAAALLMLAGPVQAQLSPLVIPATTGPQACTQGGESEYGIFGGNNLGTPTSDSVTFQTQQTTFSTSFTVYAGVQEGGTGTPQQVKDLGTSQPLATQSVNFSGLKKNTRYTFIMYGGTAPYTSPFRRLCFKTRGEFSNAEQNLFLKEGEWLPNLTQYNRTGCYAVASTRQDIRDCYCNGTRGGTPILAGQTAASQAQRQYLNCPDLDN